MGLKKRFLKTKPISKVTFRLPKEAAAEASEVHLVGSFNDWDINALPMNRLKSGEFTVTVDLPTGCDYHFRYLLHTAEGTSWVNDWAADGYAPCEFSGQENSVLVL